MGNTTQQMYSQSESIDILHVDDDSDLTALATTFLEAERNRFDVETATTAQEGLDRLEEAEFDCVISDYDMPGMNGIEFLETARESYPDLPFILFTGKGSEEIASEAISAGVTDYLQKEVGDDQYTVLANKVTNAVEKARAERQLERSQARYRTFIEDVFDTMDVGTIILDSEFTVVRTNSAIEEYFGLDREAVTGADKRQLLTTTVGSTVENSEAFTETVLATYDDNSFTEEFECHVLPGENRKERWLRHWSQPIESGLYEGGRIEHYTDITESKQRERKEGREMPVEFLRDLYDVTTDLELSFDDKIDRILELGCAELGLEHGFLTQIESDDEDGNIGTQTIIESKGDHELFRPGQSCPLSEAYCRKTIDTDGLLAIQDAVEAGWEGDPAYEKFDLGCYIGGKVIVSGEVYGTFCFGSTEPRVEPFTDADRLLVRLMSKWASYELEHHQTTTELQRANEQLEEFVSVVSHDLRNPLNVASGHLEMARVERDSEHLADVDQALERMESLIAELLTLAREGDNAPDMEAVSLAELSERCWESVDTADATLVTETTAVIRGDHTRNKRVFENLFRNAVEHGGDDVTVTVGDLGDGFYVADDGPGVPRGEREQIFENGYSTAETGTGFGLTIVQEVAESHGWDVTVTDSDDSGARFEFSEVEFIDR